MNYNLTSLSVYREFFPLPSSNNLDHVLMGHFGLARCCNVPNFVTVWLQAQEISQDIE